MVVRLVMFSGRDVDSGRVWRRPETVRHRAIELRLSILILNFATITMHSPRRQFLQSEK